MVRAGNSKFNAVITCGVEDASSRVHVQAFHVLSAGLRAPLTYVPCRFLAMFPRPDWYPDREPNDCGGGLVLGLDGEGREPEGSGDVLGEVLGACVSQHSYQPLLSSTLQGRRGASACYALIFFLSWFLLYSLLLFHYTSCLPFIILTPTAFAM